MKKLFLYFSLCFALFALSGMTCKDVTLDNTGPYKGDKFLYSTDMIIDQSYRFFDGFLLWEMQNRSFLSTNAPSVTKVADSIRINAPLWFILEGQLRAAYTNAVYLNNQANINTASNNLVLQTSVLQSQVSLAQSLMQTNK